MFCASLDMVFKNYFSCREFKMLIKEIVYDHLLARKGMFDMICSTITNSCMDNSSECMQTKNPLIVSLNRNQNLGSNIEQITELFNRYCDDLEGNSGVHMLFMKIHMIINLIFFLVKNNTSKLHVCDYKKHWKNHKEH